MSTAGTFPYRHAPFPHQRDALRASINRVAHSIFMVQGTGKSMVAICSAAHHYLRERRIDAMVIIAPNNVHVNWIYEEIPKHMPLAVPWKGLLWKTGKMTLTKRAASSGRPRKVYKDDVHAMMEYDGMSIVAVNMEAVLSGEAEHFLRSFCKRRKVFWVNDEADEFLASPGSKRYMRVKALMKGSVLRRNMTGTYVDEAPEHAYGLLASLNQKVFADDGILNYGMFKNKIIETEQRTRSDGHVFPVKVGYKNLDWLHQKIQANAFCVGEEVLNLIPPRRQHHYVQLSPEQWRMYREMEDNFVTFFQSGEAVSVKIQLTRDLRLQQIVCGYVPPDVSVELPTDFLDWEDDETIPLDLPRNVKMIPGPNYRLDAAQALAEKFPVKTIIWARFTPDIDQLCDRFGAAVSRFDGTLEVEDREEQLARFKNDRDRRVLVAHPKSLGRGRTINEAKHTIFYSNLFSARARLQAQKRNHRIGQEDCVLISDLVALNTVDVRILNRLLAKAELSAQVRHVPIPDYV